MSGYVNETDIDDGKIIRALGLASYGDEDFAVFKCPECHRIYLIDYEVESIFIDPDNIQAIRSGGGFTCESCGYRFDRRIIIGDKADDQFRVTIQALKTSEWCWILK